MRTITSMKRARFERLLRQMLDGTLMDKWEGVDEDKLTKAQRVEKRQISAIAALQESGELITIYDMEWREIIFVERGGQLQAELRR